MFINAMPRRVSHCFDAFVPTIRRHPHRGVLYDMTANEANAWSIYGSESTPQPQITWDHFYNLEDNENLLANGLPTYQDVDFQAAPSSSSSTSTSIATEHHLHNPRSQRSMGNKSTRPSFYDNSGIYVDYEDSQLFDDYRQINWSNGSENCELNNALLSNSSFRRQKQDARRCIDTLPNPSQSAFSSFPLGSDEFESSNSSPYTVESSFSPIPTFSADVISGRFTGLDVQDHNVNEWWAGMSGHAGDTHVMDLVQPFSCDGLPRDFGPWAASSTPILLPSRDDQHCDGLWTISPKVLIKDSSTAQNAQPVMQSTISRRSSDKCIIDNAALARTDGKTPANRPRRKLPSQPTGVFSVVSSSQGAKIIQDEILASQTKSTATAKHKTKSSSKTRRTKTSEDKHASTKTEIQSLASKPMKPRTSGWTTANTPGEPMPLPRHDPITRENRDEFLVRCKLNGMSYRDIRRQGGFSEAESTLRGRFRTLTKEKEERVRRPTWTDNDIRLLKRGVRKFQDSKGKVPWKKVTEHIYRSGGSYKFGNATCRKRWDELADRAGC